MTGLRIGRSVGLVGPDRAQHALRPVVGDAVDREVAAVEGTDQHAGERVEVSGLRKVAGVEFTPIINYPIDWTI